MYVFKYWVYKNEEVYSNKLLIIFVYIVNYMIIQSFVLDILIYVIWCKCLIIVVIYMYNCSNYNRDNVKLLIIQY